MKHQTNEDVFNSRGRVLAYIANNPECTIKDIAAGMFLSRRNVWGNMGELRRLLQVHKLGRVHYYKLRDDKLERLLREISTWVKV